MLYMFNREGHSSDGDVVLDYINVGLRDEDNVLDKCRKSGF